MPGDGAVSNPEQDAAALLDQEKITAQAAHQEVVVELGLQAPVLEQVQVGIQEARVEAAALGIVGNRGPAVEHVPVQGQEQQQAGALAGDKAFFAQALQGIDLAVILGHHGQAGRPAVHGVMLLDVREFVFQKEHPMNNTPAKRGDLLSDLILPAFNSLLHSAVLSTSGGRSYTRKGSS